MVSAEFADVSFNPTVDDDGPTKEAPASAASTDEEEQQQQQQPQRRGFFARLRRRSRQASLKISKAAAAAIGKRVSGDKLSNESDTDDESSSDFDCIDELLARPIIGDNENHEFNEHEHDDEETPLSPLSTDADHNKQKYRKKKKDESTLDSCLTLLSSQDVDQNRVGLQRLFLLTSGRRLSKLTSSGSRSEKHQPSEEIAGRVLVCGGELGSKEELLRYMFATMICDAAYADPREEDERECDWECDYYESDEEEALFDWILDYDPNSSNNNKATESRNDDDRDDRNEERRGGDDRSRRVAAPSRRRQGKAGGVLHNLALRVLANALVGIVAKEDDDVAKSIPLHGTVWRNIVRSLVDDIENANLNPSGAGCALKILRLLHAVRPEVVGPLLRQSLFGQLAFLAEQHDEEEDDNNYCACELCRFPMIRSEASELLRRALEG